MACGVAIEYRGAGRPARWCRACAPKNRRSDRRQHDEAVLGKAKAEELWDQSDWPSHSLAAERMAVGLSFSDDPLEAARYVGLEGLPPDQLEELADRARERHPDLLALENAATSRLLSQALALVSLKLCHEAPRANTRTANGLLANLSKAKDILGGTNMQFQPINFVLPESHPPGKPK